MVLHLARLCRSQTASGSLLYSSVTHMVGTAMSLSVCHRLRKDDPGFSIAGPYIDRTLPIHSIHSFVLKDTRFVSFFVIFSAHSQDAPSALLLTCARCDQPGCGPRRLSQGHHTYQSEYPICGGPFNSNKWQHARGVGIASSRDGLPIFS